MTRRMITLAIFAVALFSAVILALWLNEMLYFRSFGVSVSLNGETVEESALFKTANGSYLLFLNTETAKRPVYAVWDNGEGVGTPVSPVPSSYTKSIKTSLFVVCLNCYFADARSPKFDARTKTLTTEDEISFSVSPDNVTVRF